MPTDNRPDLTTCDREPIHLPGSIQPHGVLFALADGRIVEAASANAAPLIGGPVSDACGRPLEAVFEGLDPAHLDALMGPIPADRAVRLGPVRFGRPNSGSDAARTERGAVFDVLAHRSGGLTLLELETIEPDSPSPEAADDPVAALVGRLQQTRRAGEAFADVAAVIRAVCGFDRVLIYRFDETWSGTVIAEDRNDTLPSYMDLRFPASDIPAQARDLYRRNRVRQIPDADYAPVPILGRWPEPIDLSNAVLRSVSPVHVEYMRNMGTAASMSVSILTEGRLWGLIACHNRLAKVVPPAIRATCDLVAQILAMRIAVEDVHGDAADRVTVQASHARLLTAMARATDFTAGLESAPDALLGLTRAEGAAIVHEGKVVRVGATPDPWQVQRIIGWLMSRGGEDLFATASLVEEMPGAEAFADVASGVVAVSLSRVHASHILWFRSEVVRTVTWGGDPRKQFEPIGPDTRISPRKSFEAWRQTVRATSRPWTPAEIDAARSLRQAVVEIVLKRAEELAALTEDLQRSNRELEAFSYSISHDLRAPFRHIVGYAELLSERYGPQFDDKGRHYLANITESAQTAGKLVDDLLHFSQLGRVQILPVSIDMDRLVAEVVRSLAFETRDRPITWRIDPLPPATGDASLIRQVVFNLIGNAVKYTRGKEPAEIAVRGRQTVGENGAETIFEIEDNGIGFDMTYADKLFQVFQRLNRAEAFEGTGIGLALVRRIVDRHGGRTLAFGEIGKGATFTFSLPAGPGAATRGDA
ncbi:ATP-binding protein [Mongoliimonas terrestris]|uniref:ATP-binding protein n=1 Tax=Mongoliimonas terrestris TaxID=1709001 RepID=UPI000949AE57|nr:ATP-binding protein [Mongoliimonas terrestris]